MGTGLEDLTLSLSTVGATGRVEGRPVTDEAFMIDWWAESRSWDYSGSLEISQGPSQHPRHKRSWLRAGVGRRGGIQAVC